MQRVRKALAAAAGATAAGLITALVNGDQPASAEGWAALIGGSLGLGVLAGVATYKVRNAATVNGSDPLPGSRMMR